MKSNFEFLDKEFPVLAQFGKKAEAYLYSDSNSCLMKLEMIGETIVNLMFTYDRIMPPSENTAVNRIGVLYREGLLTQDLVDILHALRKVRNKAVHENYSSIEEGKVLLQMAHSLCEWFMQTYGDWNYQTVIYVNKSSDAIECFLRHRILYYRKRKRVISECRIRCFENRIEPKVVRKLSGDVTLNKGSKESNQRCNLSIKY